MASPLVLELRADEMPPSRAVPKHITLAYTGEDESSTFPTGRILLHSCCAPCSGAMFTSFLERGLDVVVFFYNPNIHRMSLHVYNIDESSNLPFPSPLPH